MTTVKLRHEDQLVAEAATLGDVPATELDAFFEKFINESIIADSNDYEVLFRDYVVEGKQVYFVICYGSVDE